MSKWHVWKPVETNWAIPACGGCYVIYVDGVAAYVGSSSDLRNRLAQYRLRPTYGRSFFTPWGEFNGVFVKYRPARFFGEWATLELRLIRRLSPTYNQQHVRRRAAV